MKWSLHLRLFFAIVLVGCLFFIAEKWNHQQIVQLFGLNKESSELDAGFDSDEQEPPPAPVNASPEEVQQAPHDTSALGGLNVLIADRGNNRLIEVTPDKRIVWTHTFNLPSLGLGADDAFFINDGKQVIVNLEEYHVIEIIDYATHQVVWSYGMPGRPGHADGYLNTPDDAYYLPNGDVIVADIKNCRVIEIAPDKHIVRQSGKTRSCGTAPGLLDVPNGDTPLPNGHILVSNIRSKELIELDANFQPVFRMPLHVNYPSDPQLTRAGDILISDYSKPGHIKKISREGNVVWDYAGDTHGLDRPSLAVELPNGTILANDDFNHRVIVVDPSTKQIVWQYGVTGKPGSADGQLNIPDGVDVISSSKHPAPSLPLHTVGQVSRHPASYVGQTVRLQGVVLKREASYVIVSDEASGPVGYYDLPVSGTGALDLSVGHAYLLEGILKKGGLVASNRNPYHLELTQTPEER